MEPSEASELTEGTPVWIWIVRQRQGQWCPGIVQRVTSVDERTNVTVRFECTSPRRNGSRQANFLSISTTQMRYLERREVSRKGTDRPQHAPPSLVVCPS